ncbi:hypothetical protein COL23_00215 [Priestia aryabhattai]|uniref:hypothetical protein n=1 Tax=Priestia aryabhattai TaxID=412384 RepID=UPI000BF7B6A6|nr:hypothetical protein [Priestia aryabhattai]PFW80074.1 hypothetical protein COL23_00215 [Priestia aryabhattai]
MKKKNNKDYFLIYFMLASYMVSFDIFLVLRLGGFSFRFAQILLAVPIAFLIANVIKKGEFKPFLSYIPLLSWFLCIVLFIPHTTYLLRNINYAIWMLFNIFLVFATVQYVDNKTKVIKLIKAYLYSYLFVGGWGIIQFALSLVGIRPFLATQWWPNGLVRVSGFSYEPSYYATYMLIGWAFVMYMKVKKSKLFKQRILNIMVGVISTSIILSSSRMGIALLGLWMFGYFIIFLGYFLKGRVHLEYLKPVLLFGAGIVLIILIVLMDNSGKYDFLLAGTGLHGTASHSLDDRSSGFEDTLTVFRESPFIGHSLGGVAPAIGGLHNVVVTSQEQAKPFEGSSIFAEVLAASGILGFLPFALYIMSLVITPLKLAKRVQDREAKNILVGMTVALIAELIILQFNQNISRLYLWYHIALLSATYSVYKKEYLSLKKRLKHENKGKLVG